MTTTAPPPTSARVRPVERADLLAVHRIEQESFPQPWPFTAFEQFLQEPGFLVADDGAVVGYIVADTVRQHGQHVGHIKDLAVREERRGEGIGALLLRQALGVLDRAGVRATKLEVRESNESAISVYRAHGFEHRRTIPDYYDDSENALVFFRTESR